MSVDHYENFPVASFLLPHHLRAAVAAIYWFARSADDIADEGRLPADVRLQQLAAYRENLARMEAGEKLEDPIFQPLSKAVREFDLPIFLLRDLLDAFVQDVNKDRYASYDELLDYCRRSANPIGRLLLCMYRTETAQQLIWSDAICTSLQLTNHWQDVDIDWQKPRVYLPADEMQRFAVDTTHLEEQRADDAWQALMRFQVERARLLMLSGAPLARTLPGRIGLELRLIVCGGLRILEKIDAVGYDIFHHRPKLTARDWPLLLWRAFFSYPK